MISDRIQASMTFQAYLRPVWAWKWMILLVVGAVTVGTYLYYDHKPRLYVATTDIFIGRSQIDQQLSPQGSGSQDDRTIQDQSRLITSRSVTAEVARRLGVQGGPDALLGAVQVTPVAGSDFITIAGSANSGEGAATLANAFARAFIDVKSSSARDEANRRIVSAQAKINTLGRSRSDSILRRVLRRRINKLKVVRLLPTGTAQQVNPAVASTTPVSPRPTRNAIFAFVLSLTLAIAAAFALYRGDRRIKDRDEIDQLYGVPVLAPVPRAGRAAHNGNATMAMALREPFRGLRANLELAGLERPMRVVLVTSALPQEGKSTVVRHLALTYSEAGARVAVLDADLRRPDLAEAFAVSREPGLTEVLTRETSLDRALQRVPVPVQGLSTVARVQTGAGGVSSDGVDSEVTLGSVDVLASGITPANPPAVLATGRLRSVLGQLAAEHDIVLIDSPPLLSVSDAIPLLSLVDGTILVARLGIITNAAARRVSTLIARIPDANLLGVVANDISEPSEGYTAYYRPS